MVAKMKFAHAGPGSPGVQFFICGGRWDEEKINAVHIVPTVEKNSLIE